MSAAWMYLCYFELPRTQRFVSLKPKHPKLDMKWGHPTQMKFLFHCEFLKYVCESPRCTIRCRLLSSATCWWAFTISIALCVTLSVRCARAIAILRINARWPDFFSVCQDMVLSIVICNVVEVKDQKISMDKNDLFIWLSNGKWMLWLQCMRSAWRSVVKEQEQLTLVNDYRFLHHNVAASRIVASSMQI